MDKKEELEKKWKDKWAIQKHTKVWWTKMCDDFYDLGRTQTLEKELEFLEDVNLHYHCNCNNSLVYERIKQISKELAGVNHSLQGSASEIEEKGMPVNTRKGCGKEVQKDIFCGDIIPQGMGFEKLYLCSECSKEKGLCKNCGKTKEKHFGKYCYKNREAFGRCKFEEVE